MAGQPEVQRTESLVQEVEPVIRGIIRRKLRVTLDPADGRRENQNGLELFGDVWVKLLQEAGTDTIRNVRSYASIHVFPSTFNFFDPSRRGESAIRQS